MPRWGSQNSFGKAKLQGNRDVYQSAISDVKVKDVICSPWKEAGESWESSWRKHTLSWAWRRSQDMTGRNHMTSSGQWMEVTSFQKKEPEKPMCLTHLPPFGSVCGAVCWNCRGSRLNPKHTDLCAADTTSVVISYWELGFLVATA